MAFRIDDDENRIQDLTDKVEQLEVQTFSPEVVARNESTRDTGVQTGDGAATNAYPEWIPIRDFGTLGNLTLVVDLNRVDSHIAKMTLNGDTDFAFSFGPGTNKMMQFILDVTIDATGGYTINLLNNILPAGITIDNTADARTVIRFTTTDGGTTYYAEDLTTGGGGGTTGTFISADLTADQTMNLAVGDHVEFDRNATPTGADGGIVLQTGAGQANGIFELKLGKTYFLSAAVAPFFGAANDIDLVWFDITNTAELGRRSRFSDAVLAMNQPKCEISFTPLTDVTVELRLIAATTPANLNGYDADHTFANIFEFSGKNGTDGAAGAAGAVTWKTPARAKTLVDVPDLALFDVITDGVTLIENDRVLLTEQATASENGLYVVGVVAGGFAPLTRPTDFDTDAEVLSETFVAIEEGSAHANELYHLITNNPILIDVTDQLWEVFAPGTSGGPDLGGGEDGVDSAGFFVNDGRIAVGAALLKNWEQIDDFDYPDNGPKHMLYLQGSFSPFLQGRVIMCGASTQARGASYSDNFGTTFTLSTGVGSNDNLIKMAYDSVGNVLVAVADDAPNAGRAIRRSTDRGTSFGVTAFAGDLVIRDVIWSVSDSQFVLCESATTTTDRIWTSPDGNTWTQQTTPAALAGGWFKLAYDSINGLYVCKGNSPTDVMTSPDAITWTLDATNITVSNPTSFIHAPGQEKFVALLGGLVNLSQDGINYTQHTITGAQIINDIIYAEDLSLFLGIGQDAVDVNPNIFWFSNDAITWFRTPANRMRKGGSIGTTFSKISVAYSEEYGIFFGTAGSASATTPFTENARLWRTSVEFNDTI